MIYGGINRRDWRTIRIEDVQTDPREVDRQLVPLLRTGNVPRRAELMSWTDRLVRECRDGLTALLPLRGEELEFLTQLNDRGEIVPELLTTDPEARQLLGRHPGLLWKALNVRQHHGIKDGSDEPDEF